jgi:hypothetical protein
MAEAAPIFKKKKKTPNIIDIVLSTFTSSEQNQIPETGCGYWMTLKVAIGQTFPFVGFRCEATKTFAIGIEQQATFRAEKIQAFALSG